MKKLLVLLSAFVVFSSAHALGVGVTGSANFSDATSRDSVGVTVSQGFDKYSLTAGVDRSIVGDTNRVSLVGGYDVTKIGFVTVTAKAGVARLSVNHSQAFGNQFIAGVGITLPVAEKVSLTADYAYHAGQANVSAFNGNTVTVGAKYSF